MAEKLNKKQKVLDGVDGNLAGDDWRSVIDHNTFRENIRIARENVGFSTQEATKKICGYSSKDRVLAWENGESYPTWIQLNKMGKEYNVNFWLFLRKEKIEKEEDIPPFRSDKSGFDENNLKKFIHYVRGRQEFLSDAIKEEGIKANRLVGSGVKYEGDAVGLAQFISKKIGYEVQKGKNPDYALRYIRSLLEERGVFVFKTLSYQKIDVGAMKGMYIGDSYAPVIALNRDKNHSKRASIFTLVHEIAHLFLDDSRVESVSFRNGFNVGDNIVESFCNEVAANLLLPSEILENRRYSIDDVKEVAKKFSVSNLVVFYRLRNLGYISRAEERGIKKELDKEYGDYLVSLRDSEGKDSFSGGGNFYNNMKDSNGELFNNFIGNLYFEGKIDAFNANYRLGMPLRKL